MVIELPETEPERPVYAVVDALVCTFVGTSCAFFHEKDKNRAYSGIVVNHGLFQECTSFAKKKQGVISFTIKKTDKKSASLEFIEKLGFKKPETFNSQVSY